MMWEVARLGIPVMEGLGGRERRLLVLFGGVDQLMDWLWCVLDEELRGELAEHGALEACRMFGWKVGLRLRKLFVTLLNCEAVG